MLKQGAFGGHIPAHLCATILSLVLAIFSINDASAQGQVPIESECVSFAKEIAQEAQLDGLTAVYRQISLEGAAAAAMPGLRLKPAEVKALFLDYSDGLRDFGDRTKKDLLEFSYVNYLPNNKKPQVIFRATYRNGAQTFLVATLDFHDSLLSIVDLFHTTTIESLSEALRRVASPKLKESSPARWEKLFRQPPPGGADPYTTWQAVYDGATNGNHKAVLENYDKLLPEFKETLTMRSLHLLAVARAKKEAYRQTWDEYHKAVGSQTGAPFVMLAAALVTTNQSDGMKATTDMEKVLGNDPIIHVLRTDICMNAGDLEGAFKHAAPGLTKVRAFDFRSQIYLHLGIKLKKWKEMSQFLRELERDSRYESVSFLASHPPYAVIVHSEDFAKWLESPVKKRYNPELLEELRNKTPNPDAPVASKPAAPPAPPAAVATSPSTTAKSTIPATAKPAVSPVPAKPGTPPAFVLKGIIFSSRPTANINGKVVMEGERVGKAKVIKITQHNVIIELDGQQETLVIE